MSQNIRGSTTGALCSFWGRERSSLSKIFRLEQTK